MQKRSIQCRLCLSLLQLMVEQEVGFLEMAATVAKSDIDLWSRLAFKQSKLGRIDDVCTLNVPQPKSNDLNGACRQYRHISGYFALTYRIFTGTEMAN